MVQTQTGATLDVRLIEETASVDRIGLVIDGALHPLDPHSARVLATELIMAVNRAEVRNSLRHAPVAARTTQLAAAEARGILPPLFAR